MGVLTISRELGSLGDKIAHVFSEELGYKWLDKMAIENRLNEYGMSDVNIDKYDERKPSFWSSFMSDKDKYLHFLKSAMYDVVKEGKCVILGRGAQMILKGLPGVLHIRTIADNEIRLTRIKERYQCDDRTAHKIIEGSDHERSGFHRFFFDSYWDYTEHYDIIINTSRINIDFCVNLLKDAIELLDKTDYAKDLEARINNMIMTQNIKTKILYEDRVPMLMLEVDVADDGEVFIRGTASTEDSISCCREIANKIEGVKTVNTDIDVMLNYKKRLT